MAVVKTCCQQGHPLTARGLVAVRGCVGCGMPCSTVYDCASGCYGKCCDCWVKEVRDQVAGALATPGEV